MSRPERLSDLISESQEIMIFTGEDLALDNFMALYGCTIVAAYRDGRIKIRTPAGRHTDLHRDRDIAHDCWIFDAKEWATQIHEVDTSIILSPFASRRSPTGIVPVPRGTK